MARFSRDHHGTERGATAVEMAIVLPVLLILVMGIMDFGRAFTVQISLTQAAREGARYYAIHNKDAGYNLGVYTTSTAPMLSGLPVAVSPAVIPAGGCFEGELLTVTTSVSLPSLTGFFPFFPLAMSGKGVMQCGG